MVFRIGCMNLTKLAGLAIALGVSSGQPAIAHNIQTSGDVAATFHIEPDHNPKAGEESLTWFVLTQTGGKQIPADACDCQLKVYEEPYKKGDFSVLEPPLKPISAEKYQEIPGAKITFPRGGRYILEISGKAKDGLSFKPFQFRYPVTVRAGQVAATPSPFIEKTDTSTASATEAEEDPILFWAAVLFGFGIAAALMLKPKQ